MDKGKIDWMSVALRGKWTQQFRCKQLVLIQRIQWDTIYTSVIAKVRKKIFMVGLLVGLLSLLSHCLCFYLSTVCLLVGWMVGRDVERKIVTGRAENAEPHNKRMKSNWHGKFAKLGFIVCKPKILKSCAHQHSNKVLLAARAMKFMKIYLSYLRYTIWSLHVYSMQGMKNNIT